MVAKPASRSAAAGAAGGSGGKAAEAGRARKAAGSARVKPSRDGIPAPGSATAAPRGGAARANEARESRKAPDAKAGAPRAGAPKAGAGKAGAAKAGAEKAGGAKASAEKAGAATAGAREAKGAKAGKAARTAGAVQPGTRLDGTRPTAVVGRTGAAAAATKAAPRPRVRSRASLELNKAKKSHFDEGSLDQYLKEISQYPLITREDEVELAKRIKKGDQAALEKLCRSNLRFVVSVAKKYQNQGVSLADLINEGNLGLIRAAHKFDETKGIKFISYAVWWIRQAILQALAEQSRIVRVPLNRAGTLHRIGKKSNSLLQELGREPTVEEIADGMDISLEEVRKTMSISQSHLSLDAPLTPGEDNKLLDYLPDEYNPSPDDSAFERALGEAIQESLDTLKPREAKILKLYYGLDNQEAMTLEEIGSVLGITRERVRQIKEKALSRLRHVSRARALQSFLT
jgi:RNA polymerase primary sigma factor